MTAQPREQGIRHGAIEPLALVAEVWPNGLVPITAHGADPEIVFTTAL